ncbi:MAG: phosphoglycerate kinase [Alphaproteobacteria bacterium]|nr:phosphoglycerate kinase [Rickettsiales bacterium]
MLLQIDTIKDVVTTGKVVAVRVDFNVPIVKGDVQDVSRIKAAAKTIQFLRQNGAKILLLSHLGRPKNGFDDVLSMSNLVQVCSEILGTQIYFIKDVSHQEIKKTLDKMDYGEVALLENLRFYNGELTNDVKFASIIASLCNVYVNEAFSCSHRKHASIDAITTKLSCLAGGFALLEEVNTLNKIFSNPKQPKVAILGGSKISTKIGLLKHLCTFCETICLGGGMANTILYYKGVKIGKSLYELNVENSVNEFLTLAQKLNCKVVLPTDFIVLNNNKVTAKEIKNINDNDQISDIGLHTCESIKNVISKSNTIIMNGPLGIYEQEPFQEGTILVLQSIVQRTKATEVKSVVGGGDIVSCINRFQLQQHGFTFVSNAGGAFLELISGKELPGINAIKRTINNKRQDQ